MKKIRLIAACVAVLVVIVVCFAGLSGNGEKTKTEEATVSVVVASADIPAYTVVSADMITVANVPKSALPEGVTTYSKVEDVVGSISLSQITKNETILSNHLRAASEATVTPSIQTGMRAMTISVTDTTGISGLIRVGNRVDLFYTADDRAHSGDTASTLLAENVTVLALDQQLSDSKASSNSSDGSSSSSKATYDTVTLHVSVEQAAEISAAVQGKGTIYLALRNQSDNSTLDETNASTYDIL